MSFGQKTSGQQTLDLHKLMFVRVTPVAVGQMVFDRLTDYQMTQCQPNIFCQSTACRQNDFWPKGLKLAKATPMFVERWHSYSALFTFLVVWHASAVGFLPPGDIILAQLTCPLNDIFFC